MTDLQEQLFALQDKKYREFHCRLIPGVDKNRVIGIRVPVLRKFAKKYTAQATDEEREAFFRQLPHTYYEENNLHVMWIAMLKDYDMCLAELERFLPYIDNWATCDFAPPKCFEKHKKELWSKIRLWIRSGETYTVRYAVGLLMRFYLDQDFDRRYSDAVAEIRSEEYYVNMMIAWYFATALAKQWDAVIPYIEEHRLADWTHKKTIQKAIESYRITPEQKEYLRSLR